MCSLARPPQFLDLVWAAEPGIAFSPCFFHCYPVGLDTGKFITKEGHQHYVDLCVESRWSASLVDLGWEPKRVGC